MNMEGTSCTVAIKVIAIPLTPQDNHLKLVSINQLESLDINKYKPFDLLVEEESSKNNSIQFLESALSNITNLNFISILSLQKCALQTLPKIIHMLPLKELYLEDNKFEHVPECLYLGLENVECLNISKNLIKWFPIPNCYSSLKTLKLAFCKFENLPEWIPLMKCIHLEKLDYSGNKLGTKLQRLDQPVLDVELNNLIFCNTKLVDAKLEFFKTFKLLQYLDLSNTGNINCNVIYDITSLVTNSLWCNHIKVLKLNNLGIADLMKDFYKLPNLKELHLKGNSLWNISADINTMKELVVLDISHNCIYDVPQFIGLDNLKELHASNNHINHVEVAHLPRLKYLDLYNNELQTVKFDSATVELIDFDQNYVDSEILSNVNNYAERREALRQSLSRNGETGFCVKRYIGRKLEISDSESVSTSSEKRGLDDLDESYTNLDGEDLELSREGFFDVSKEDGNSDDGHESDWGDVISNLVTLSDSEFIPENNTLKSISLHEMTDNKNVLIELEELFIDAD